VIRERKKLSLAGRETAGGVRACCTHSRLVHFTKTREIQEPAPHMLWAHVAIVGPRLRRTMPPADARPARALLGASVGVKCVDSHDGFRLHESPAGRPIRR